MNTTLSFQYPFWFIIFCLAAGTGYAALLYYRDTTFDDKDQRSLWWKYTLTGFRFLGVTILCILLLSPFLRSRNTQQFKPIIAVVNDNSESMLQGLKGDSSMFKKNLQNLISTLSNKYEVVEFNAGNELKQGINYAYQDKSTDLSAAIEDLNDLYYNRNLGAVILASDGIYNKGINPVYTANKASYQIYTIAVGDTSMQKDQKLSNVYYNKITYLHDQFGIKVDLEQTNLAGKNVKLSVYEIAAGNEARLIQSKDITYTDNTYFQTFDFTLPADHIGIARYRISVSNTEGEITYRNNARDIFVEVLDGRQKILLVANSPHPDIAAFKSAIESNKNYQLEVVYAESFTQKLNDYNLVILHQLPSNSQKASEIFRQARDLKKSLLFVLGSQTWIPDFQKAQNALLIKGNADKFNEVTANLSKDFALFTISDKTAQTLPKLPPMTCFFGDYNSNPSSKILLTQKINSVETNYPLWLLNENGEQKVGVIAAEGIWRWRLHDYLINKNHDATNEIINKTVQYLSIKNDKRPFKVNQAKSIFQDNEVISFDAQLYNANYELINNTDVEIKIKGDSNKQYDFKFNRTENAYTLNAGFLPVGNYSYTANATLGNSNYTANGKFSVSPLQLEEMRTRADHQVLYQLASQHGGSMYHLSDMEQIAKEIDNKNQLKPILFDTFLTESAINLKWIFFLILCLLSAEWISRKYLGGY